MYGKAPSTTGGTAPSSARRTREPAEPVHTANVQGMYRERHTAVGGPRHIVPLQNIWYSSNFFPNDPSSPRAEGRRDTRLVQLQSHLGNVEQGSEPLRMFIVGRRDLARDAGHMPSRRPGWERTHAVEHYTHSPCAAPTTEASPSTDATGCHELSDDELAYLYRNYGCVFTSASFTLWSQLLQLFKVLVLQPERAYMFVNRLMPAFDWLLIRNIRECQMSPDLGDLPNLRDFVDAQAHLVTDGIMGPDHQSSLSMLARLVNKVESVATLMELLHRCLEFTCAKCTSAVSAHYDRRISVIDELRIAVYPMCMLSLLQKRLPEVPISEMLQRPLVVLRVAFAEIEGLMSALTTHLSNMQHFIEAADCGSIPMPVKLMLWHYGCIVMKSTAEAVYELMDEVEAHPDIMSTVKSSYQRPLEHCRNIHDKYQAEAEREVRRYKPVIAHLAVYETVMQSVLNSRD